MEELLKRTRVNRLSKIFCRISLFLGIVTLILGAMPVVKFLYYLIAVPILLAVLVAWLLSLILFMPFNISFLGEIFTGEEFFTKVEAVAKTICPYFGAVAITLGAVALVLWLVNKKFAKPTGGIVISSIGIVLAAIGLLLAFSGVFTV